MINRTKGAGRLSFTPQGTVTGEVGGKPITFRPITNTITTPVSSGEVGDIQYQAGIGANISDPTNPTPTGYLTAQKQSGDVTYNASVSPQGAGVGARYSTDIDGNRLTISGNIGPGGVSVTPTFQVGSSPGSAEGAQLGGNVGAMIGSTVLPGIGTAAGSLIGSAIGSTVGGATGGGRSRKEHDVRNNIIKALDQAGIWDRETRIATNPDGSTFDFSLTGKGGEHKWANINRRIADHSNRDSLFSYDTDYTNDLDYVSNMAGNTLSRLLLGKVDKASDQFGGQLGNAFLGKSGYGAQMTKETFDNTMNNARAYYAKVGVGTKEDLLGLANKLYADGQIKDVDYAVMQQTAGMLYDGDFATAQKLMAGIDKGIAKAAKTPTASEGTAEAAKTPAASEGQASRVWHSTPQDRIISAEEAWAQTKPFFDLYRRDFPSMGSGGGMSTMNKGLTALAATAGGYRTIDAVLEGLTGRGATERIRDWWNEEDTEGDGSWLESIQGDSQEQNMTPLDWEGEQNMTPIDQDEGTSWWELW